MGLNISNYIINIHSSWKRCTILLHYCYIYLNRSRCAVHRSLKVASSRLPPYRAPLCRNWLFTELHMIVYEKYFLQWVVSYWHVHVLSIVRFCVTVTMTTKYSVSWAWFVIPTRLLFQWPELNWYSTLRFSDHWICLSPSSIWTLWYFQFLPLNQLYMHIDF